MYSDEPHDWRSDESVRGVTSQGKVDGSKGGLYCYDVEERVTTDGFLRVDKRAEPITLLKSKWVQERGDWYIDWEITESLSLHCMDFDLGST